MKYNKTAIIFGITGQDGSYLSNYLLKKKYKVIGITRNKQTNNLHRLKKLNLIKKINLLKGEATDLKFCKKIITSKVNEIYYLSGYSSVVGSFLDPDVSIKSNV